MGAAETLDSLYELPFTIVSQIQKYQLTYMINMVCSTYSAYQPAVELTCETCKPRLCNITQREGCSNCRSKKSGCSGDRLLSIFQIIDV